MTGVVDDEGTFFVSAAFGAPAQNVTAGSYQPLIAGFLGLPDPAAVAALYPTGSYPTPNQALARVYGDYRVICGILQDTDNIAAALPASAKAYVYKFSEKTPYTNFLSLPNRLPPTNVMEYGAFHGADVNYWYDQMTGTTTPAQLQLAQNMEKAFANFARTGNPSVAGTLPAWQPYSAAERGTVMEFTHAASTATANAYNAHNCGFWYGQPPSNRL